MRLRLLLLSLLCWIRLFAGDQPYAVSNIPAALLKGANAVVRLHEEHVVVKNLEHIVVSRHLVITILNEQADSYAGCYEWYDSFNSVEDMDGILYNAEGKKIKSMRKGDIRDLPAGDNVSFVLDGRVKIHNFYHKIYPYTVEYTVRYSQNETMFLPHWRPVPGEYVAVETSASVMEVPTGYRLRYKAFNLQQEPQVTEKGGRTAYAWSLNGYPAARMEPYSVGWKESIPWVMRGPTAFRIESYDGNMADWNELGMFQSLLNRGRDQLPTEVKTRVRQLTEHLPGIREKVAILYDYLQKNTRYVGIQLGIGGWRPMDASYVATNGYGDCKALSNFMYSLLKEAGIRSCYALVNAGETEPDFILDFASQQFNHVILCVPDGRDSIWLECTSQTTQPGYMGKFTGNRHALIVSESGGTVVKTPYYGIGDNVQQRRITARLDEKGTLDVSVRSDYMGMRQDDIHRLIHRMAKDKLQEQLQDRLDLSTYHISSFEYNESVSRLPAIRETLQLQVSNYAPISGRRLFIAPNILTRSPLRAPYLSKRQTDILLRIPYTEVDSVEIEIPAGYRPEAIPPDVSFRNQFGNYASTVQLKGNRLLYFRKLEHNDGRFPASDYDTLVDFYDNIRKSDLQQVVFVKQ